MKKRGKTISSRQMQYIIAGTLVVIAVIGMTVLYSNHQEKERQQMEAELSTEIQNLALQEETETQKPETAKASATIPPVSNHDAETLIPELGSLAAINPEESETETASEEEVANQEEPGQTVEASIVEDNLHFSPEAGMIWPLEGNVILNYSMDSTVYFATLDQYKYNPAIMIAGEVNSKVYSVAKGRVISIETNEVTGCTMTVDLGDGYHAIYGQLKEPNFAVGDYVESGHVLGYVSEPTKYFSVEGSNLYFELEKDGEPVNPVGYFES